MLKVLGRGCAQTQPLSLETHSLNGKSEKIEGKWCSKEIKLEKNNQSHLLARKSLFFPRHSCNSHWPWWEEQIVIRFLQTPFFFPVSPLSQLFRHCDQIEWVHEWHVGASLLSFLCDCAHQRNWEDPGRAEGSSAGNSHSADQGSSRLWWKGFVLHKDVVLTCGADEFVCVYAD